MEVEKIERAFLDGDLKDVTNEGFLRGSDEKEICLAYDEEKGRCASRFAIVEDEGGNIFTGVITEDEEVSFAYMDDYKSFFKKNEEAEALVRAYMFSREEPERVLLNGDGWRDVFPHIKELKGAEQENFITEVFK